MTIQTIFFIAALTIGLYGITRPSADYAIWGLVTILVNGIFVLDTIQTKAKIAELDRFWHGEKTNDHHTHAAAE